MNKPEEDIMLRGNSNNTRIYWTVIKQIADEIVNRNQQHENQKQKEEREKKIL